MRRLAHHRIACLRMTEAKCPHKLAPERNVQVLFGLTNSSAAPGKAAALLIVLLVGQDSGASYAQTQLACSATPASIVLQR